jgi:hypothetical protein
MTEQSVSSPRLASASLGDPKETVRPANLPAGDSSYPSGHVMNDADPQRLNEIHSRMRRIVGHKELSPRQWKSLWTLIAEATGRKECPFCDVLPTMGATMMDQIFSEELNPCGIKPRTPG